MPPVLNTPDRHKARLRSALTGREITECLAGGPLATPGAARVSMHSSQSAAHCPR
jgi:hypothetical protein